MRKIIFRYMIVGSVFLSLLSCINTKNETQNVAYIMPYFKSKSEKLHMAYSYDAKNWTALNNNQPVFDSGVRLRDPYISRVNGKFHMVHTKGWDHPTIFHWESDDLINWTGGAIDVVDSSLTRAWAPEFTYSKEEQCFYVYWASLRNNRCTMHYVKTKTWDDFTSRDSKVYYDLGMHVIDLSITKHNDTYYCFHKTGEVNDKMGNRFFTTKTLEPEGFVFKEGDYGAEVLPNQSKPTEGPEFVKLIGEDKWYVYGDPFGSALEAWETTDFKTFKKIKVSTPKDSKHCSFIHVTQDELNALQEKYSTN